VNFEKNFGFFFLSFPIDRDISNHHFSPTPFQQNKGMEGECGYFYFYSRKKEYFSYQALF